VTLYSKNTAFTWWERLPAANTAAATVLPSFIAAGSRSHKGNTSQLKTNEIKLRSGATSLFDV
jgi:hypothetical protein